MKYVAKIVQSSVTLQVTSTYTGGNILRFVANPELNLRYRFHKRELNPMQKYARKLV